MKVVYALSFLALLCDSLSYKSDKRWRDLQKAFPHSYKSPEEEEKRFQHFALSFEKYSYWNRHLAEASYGFTPIADRLPEELFAPLTVPQKVQREPRLTSERIAVLPDAYDARQDKLITPIRHQRKCPSSWAFAAVTAISASYAKKHGGHAPLLSEQQVLDCLPESQGCSGGWPMDALMYAKEGLMFSYDYKYEGKKGSCRVDTKKTRTKAGKVGYLAASEESIMDAVLRYGSVVAPMNGGKLQYYHGGVILPKDCGEELDHVVNIVGWGDANGKRYWICKNSWGKQWGDEGYFLIKKGENACQIESYPMYVTSEDDALLQPVDEKVDL